MPQLPPRLPSCTQHRDLLPIPDPKSSRSLSPWKASTRWHVRMIYSPPPPPPPPLPPTPSSDKIQPSHPSRDARDSTTVTPPSSPRMPHLHPRPIVGVAQAIFYPLAFSSPATLPAVPLSTAPDPHLALFLPTPLLTPSSSSMSTAPRVPSLLPRPPPCLPHESYFAPLVSPRHFLHHWS
jgi:hypothetical protein